MAQRIWLGLGLTALLTAGGCGSVFTFSDISRDQGIKSYEAGDYDAAEGAFVDAIRQNARDYRSHTYLGLLYDRKQQYTNALAHYKTGLEVQQLSDYGKKDVDFRVKTLTAQADTIAKVPGDAAVNDLETKALTSVTGEEAYQLARIYTIRGDADSALAAYNKAGAQAPGKFYIAKAQGLYLNKLGLKKDAEPALIRAYRLNDQDAEVQTALRGLGIVPGPSLKETGQLKKPLLPSGPLPDWLNRNRQPGTPETPTEVPADTR